MARMPMLKAREIIRALESVGFEKSRQTGSHAMYMHPDGRTTTVPIHSKDVGRGLLRKIIRDIEMIPETFFDLL